MTARDSNFANAYEGTLTVAFGPTDLTCVVDTTSGAPATPCYLCIEPTEGARREYVFFDGTFTGTTLVTTNIANRYLSGSAAGSGITHPVGAKVRSVPAAQMFEDLHDRIDGKQPLDTDLTAFAALVSAANKVPYATGAGTWALADFTAAGRALVDDADAAAQRTTLGLGTAATKDTGYTASKIPVLTATPGTPDGTKFLRDDGTWASGSSSTPANDDASVATAETTSSGSFTDLATPGPAVTVTTGAKALIIVSAQLSADTINQDAYMGCTVSGASTIAASIANSLSLTMAVANKGGHVSYAYIEEGLTAGSNTFTAKYRHDTSGAASFANRHISVIIMGS